MAKKHSRIAQLAHHPSAGGVMLIIAAALALFFANSALSPVYQTVLTTKVSITAGDIGLSKSFHHWINDGLMAIFFFMVGLEIKREIVKGELSSLKQALLPLGAAAGGIIAPALIYMSIVSGNELYERGWAIPSATDIAFALGILSLLGPRVPISIKILLTAIAVIDDMAAVIIIALFYTTSLSYIALILSAAFIAILFILNRFKVQNLAPYIILGLMLWASVLESGVHATLAGVITAFFIPITHIEKLIDGLHGWVAFLIMPLFALANAGLSFDGMSLADLGKPLTLAIILGLFVGKQVGIFGIIWLMHITKISPKPHHVNWLHLYGMALLCGIGFTMSLFIGTLAFPTKGDMTPVQLGIMAGSTLSAICGYITLRFASRRT